MTGKSDFLKTLDSKVLEYYDFLTRGGGIPDWLVEYIETPAMLHQHRISMTCGTIYTDLFPSTFYFSSLMHSIAVALIVWNFTHNKKQALAGLFHDIATPAFKHCVDFLDGDYEVEESTEELTTEIISHSEEIMALLARDGIDVCEVDDYHIYPIADNDTPRLAADRLEYSMSNLCFTYDAFNLSLDDIRRFYDDLEIQKNEDGLPELGFRHKTVARDFVKFTSKTSIIYRNNLCCYSMELIARILRGLQKDGLIKRSDLWRLGENEMVDIIENSRFADVFDAWRHAKELHISDSAPADVFYIHEMRSKVRYIDPLIKGQRASLVDSPSAAAIRKNLAYKNKGYAYLDFALPA